MTDSEISEEIQKCKDSPVYFLNKYHNLFENREITQEEYNNTLELINKRRVIVPTGGRTQKFNDWWYNRKINTLKSVCKNV